MIFDGVLEFVFGNVVGLNMVNVLLVLGVFVIIVVMYISEYDICSSYV